MAVVVLQRDKDTNFMKMLRTYLSYVNMSGIVNETKKRMYFVSPSVKRKLKRIEASRKVKSNNKSSNKTKMGERKQKFSTSNKKISAPNVSQASSGPTGAV